MLNDVFVSVLPPGIVSLPVHPQLARCLQYARALVSSRFHAFGRCCVVLKSRGLRRLLRIEIDVCAQVKVYRSSSHDGHSSSRFKASAVAKGNVLIFVDPMAVVNHGWIQPLIAKLMDEPKLVAVPHYDDWTHNDRLV